MITREQAEQAFNKYSESLTLTYEIRNPRFEAVDAKDIGSDALPLEDEISITLEETAWLCMYERKYKSTWGVWQWNTVTCYIVEAKPGPYVIE